MSSTSNAHDQQLLSTLTKLGGHRQREDEIEVGEKLVLPRSMSIPQVIDFLHRFMESQETVTAFQREFRYRPLDGAAAVARAIKRVTGTNGIGKAQVSFFGTTPPQQVQVEIAPGERISVPWGAISVPMFQGTMYLGAGRDEELGPIFRLMVEAPRRFGPAIDGLFRVVDDELEQRSIYRGKAINGSDSPEFLDLTGVSPERVIYSAETMAQLEANIWTPIRHSDTMREMRVPLKRAALLEGPYGTGKTLAAFLTAQIATDNGWTFLFCRPNRDDLETVLQTARLYQPSVVFFEDVDTVADPQPGEHDRISGLLDAFDGITAKGTELIAVMTTNHAEKIHKGMIRPGRLDAVIPIGPWDRAGIARAIVANVDADLIRDVDLDEAAAAMDGMLPAFVKEAIDRAQRYAVARTGGRPESLATADFVSAAEGLRPQLALMEDAPESATLPPLEAALRATVKGGASAVLDGAVVDGEDWVATVHANGRD